MKTYGNGGGDGGEGGRGGGDGGACMKHWSSPSGVGNWKDSPEPVSAALAQSGHAGQTPPPTSIHVDPSEAQQDHPVGHVEMQLGTRWCSASEHEGRQRGYGSVSIGRAPPPCEESVT